MAQKLLSIAVVVHALLRIHVGARSDLLVPRLKLRYGVLAASGTYMLVEILGERVLRGGTSAEASGRLESLKHPAQGRAESPRAARAACAGLRQAAW